MSELPHPSIPNKNREPSLDLIRGTAVILMILAHAIYFFHDGSNPLLIILARTGNSIVFTLFLFSSAAATYFAFAKNGKPATESEKQKIRKRSLVLLAGYYIVALLSTAASMTDYTPAYILRNIFEILVFWHVPSFAEFILPFIIYSLSVITFKPLYHRLSNNPVTAMIAGLSIYFAAYLIYLTPVSGVLSPYKAIFFGEEGLLRFPVFQYFPVFVLGLSWGKILDSQENNRNIRLQALLSGLFFTLTGVIFSVSSLFIKNPLLDPLNRWPPSLGFLTTGIAAFYLLFLIFTIIPLQKIFIKIWQFIAYLGQDSYDMYIVHIIILFFYQIFFHRTFPEPLTVMFLFSALTLSSVAISSLNWNVSPSVYTIGKISFGVYGKYRLKKRYLLSVLLMILFLNLFIINGNTGASMYGGEISKNSLLSQTPNGFGDISGKTSWYNPDYRYNRRISIRNFESEKNIPAGSSLTFSLNHRNLVSAGKSLPDGSDLLVVYQSGSGFTPVKTQIQNPNSADTKIIFETIRDISPGAADNAYFMYYGTEIPAARRETQPLLELTGSVYSIDIGDETPAKYILSLTKKWHLITQANNRNSLTLSLPDVSDKKTLTYFISNSVNGQTVQKGSLTDKQVDISNLPPGNYLIRVIITPKSGTEIPTNTTRFYISDPVYIAWTLDWEGWSVPDQVYKKLEMLSAKHGQIPYTHFLNPRIFIPGLESTSAAIEQADWLKNRIKSNSDATALHLHMQYDFVESSGVTPKTVPNWGYKNGKGYDVFLTAYSQSEISRMLIYAKKLFTDNGLPEPSGFRAGGWFADKKVLEALIRENIKYDSSGRDKLLWNGLIKSPWDLTDTSQPYYPSRLNINKSGNDPMDILEIPNNGGNTNEYNSVRLTGRLMANYRGGVSDTDIAVVFLSHPQWADTELPEADRTMDYIDKYRFDSDLGPVIYTTVDDIYRIWKK
jgi:uncharacterized membrane protein